MRSVRVKVILLTLLLIGIISFSFALVFFAKPISTFLFNLDNSITPGIEEIAYSLFATMAILSLINSLFLSAVISILISLLTKKVEKDINESRRIRRDIFEKVRREELEDITLKRRMEELDED